MKPKNKLCKMTHTLLNPKTKDVLGFMKEMSKKGFSVTVLGIMCYLYRFSRKELVGIPVDELPPRTKFLWQSTVGTLNHLVAEKKIRPIENEGDTYWVLN